MQKCLSVSPILNFHCWCSVSLGRLLIESVLKGFLCVFPQTLLQITEALIVSTALMEELSSHYSAWSLSQ